MPMLTRARRAPADYPACSRARSAAAALAVMAVAAMAVTTAALLAPAASAQSSYTVELLAFEQPSGRQADAALWAFDATPPAPANPEIAAVAAPGALSAVRSRLDASGYATVAHVAWQQAVRSQAEATPTAVPANDSAVGSLGGYVRIWRGRYLHVETDLHYRDNSGGQREGRLRVSRKVPAGQPVYLDHELFGIVLQLRR